MGTWKAEKFRRRTDRESTVKAESWRITKGKFGAATMRKLDSQKFISYMTYQVFMSPAFRDLKPAAKDILIQIYFEIEMSSAKSRSKKYTPTVTNRYDIKLTYREIKSRLGYSEKTIWTSFKQMLANGFLKVIKHGGGGKGDIQIYGITEDWRKWKKGQEIRTIQKNGKIGRQRQTKISGTVGKPLRGTVGKPLRPKKEGGLPTGKLV